MTAYIPGGYIHLILRKLIVRLRGFKTQLKKAGQFDMYASGDAIKDLNYLKFSGLHVGGVCPENFYCVAIKFIR